MEKIEQTFSWEALIRIVVMGVIVLLCWRALSILPVIIIALVLTVSFYPIVKKLKRATKIPLIFSIFLVLIVPIIPFIFLGYLFIPRIVAEIPNLLASLNYIISHSSFFGNFNIFAYFQSHFDYVTATNATVNIAMVIFSIITTVVLTFFLMYDLEKLFELFLHTVPNKEKTRVKELLKEIAGVTGRYIRGNLLISAICGLLVFAGLSVLRVPYALPLAIFAAIIDLLPLVGQTIGAIPAVIIGFGVSPLTGVLVIILHLVYQQVENAIISPMIYNKALNLFPSIVFLSVLLGASLFGLLGAFLSLPIAASIPAIIHYHKNYKLRHENLLT
jgi:predicted PurR-regulated permease PerM